MREDAKRNWPAVNTADRFERHRSEKASGGGQAARFLTGARHSLAKAAFPAAGRQAGNSGKAQRTLQTRSVAWKRRLPAIHPTISRGPARTTIASRSQSPASPTVIS